MKEVLTQFAMYNAWANERIINAITLLAPNVIDRNVDSSFPSLHLTALHCWETELAWWNRLHLEPSVVSSPQNKTLSFDQIAENWKKQSLQWQQWVTEAEEAQLMGVILYKNSRNEEFKQPAYQIILHVFNHATYHRGQLVSILHQLAVKEIPNTDFINWSRNYKPV